MIISVVARGGRRFRLGFLAFTLCVFASANARAGLNFVLDVIRDNHGNSYRFYTPVSTNTTAPDPAVGMYFISSPQWPTNGSTRQYEMTSNGFNPNAINGQENLYSDYASMMQQITNGSWTILFTNATTTNLFTFTVSAPTMTSNMVPATIITFPANDAINVVNQPTFTWQGPTNIPINNLYSYVANYDFSFYQPASITAAQTNWIIPTPIPDGVNCIFFLSYITNYTTPLFVATTPLNTNASHQAISGWLSSSTIETGDSVSFAVTNPPVATPLLVAHYTFDDSGNLGQDSSGNGYDLDFNGGDGVTSTNDARVGGGAAYFDGNSFFSYNSTPTNVLNTLAGDFSLSFWIKTTQNDGNENGDAYAGDGIVAEDIPGGAYDLVPAALDGGEIGFNTGGNLGDDTVNSTTDINDGNYHHVVITRDEATGEKQIYIDGVLNHTDIATMNPLSDPRIVAIGCAIDASQSDPNNADLHQFFQGQLDDLQLYAGVLSSNQVAQIYTAAPAGTTLVAHYTFDNSGNLGQDSSGNGNDMARETHWGPQYQFATDAEAGGGAIQFFGTDAIFAENQALTNLNAVLAGSFTFSTWVKTTVTNGADGNNAYFGAVIFWAYNDHGNTNDTIPLAITGSKAAFTTRGGNPGLSDNLHSLTSVNDGNYHLITVTRDQNTGEKKMYVDGNFETSQIGTTNSLNGNNYNITIGGWNYPIDGTGTNYSSYKGLLDDLQIYSGVLSASDVAYLYNNPGSSVANSSAQDFNPALNTTGLPWVTTGDTSWFIETTNTSDGVSAAQSGIVTNNQTSTLSVTVTGPGTLTFSWACMADDADFDYIVYTNGDPNGGYMDDLYYNTSGWYQDGPFRIPAGTQTISWTAFAYGDTDPTEAGFLDQVSFIPDTAPTITLNPFNQTNHPGYSVWLSASATSNPAATWQWYKVGLGQISGATSYYYIPTNSGTAGVVGQYYAIASNSSGSAVTTTAAVSFVSAPLPPDWSLAMKSPFQAVDSSQFNKDYYLGCAVDSAGEIYVAAQYFGNMDVIVDHVASNVLTAVGTNGAAALVKHGADGKPIWGVGLTNNQPASYSYGICVAPAPGNGAYFESAVIGTNWLGTNIFADNGSGSILLSRFDASGSNIWSRLIGKTNGVFPLYNTLVSDASGNVTVAGLMSGTVDVGGTNLTVPSGQAGFMVQYDSNNVVRWAQTLPEIPFNLAYSTGKLYVSLPSVNSSGVTSVSIGALSNVTDRAWGVACLNATNGQPLWLRDVGEQSGANYTGVSDDVPLISVSGSDVFLTGTAYGSSAAFGGLSVSWPGARGQYFARYDTNGNPQVATSFGSPATATWSSAADTSGVYVCGDFDGYSIFGANLIAAPIYGQNDLGPNYFTQPFVAKFDRNGNPLWARNGVSTDLANFRGIATASDGVWATGFVKINNLSNLAQFGTNSVYGDYYIVSVGIFGTIFETQGGLITKITDSSAVALPVTILNPQDNGVNFQLSFQSQTGFTHNILYTTNLVSGTWLTNSTVVGDGTVKIISVPLSLFSPAKQGFIRVSTQ